MPAPTFDDVWASILDRQIVWCHHFFKNKGIWEVRPFLCMNVPRHDKKILMAVITKQLHDYFPYDEHQAVYLERKVSSLPEESVILCDDVIAKDVDFIKGVYLTGKFEVSKVRIPAELHKRVLNFMLASDVVKETHRQILCVASGRDYSPLFTPD